MKMTTLLRRAILALWLSLWPSHAATYTWTGAGFFGNQDYLWSNPNNWAGLAAPSPGEANVTIVFPNNSAPKVTTNDLVGLSVSAIQFQGSNYVVHGKPAGNPLALYSTGLGGWSLIASLNGNYFAGTSPLVLSNSGSVSVASGAVLSVLSGISGAGNLTKFNSGTLRYAAGAANTFTGTTTVSDGTLDLNNGTLFPAATYVAIAGPLVIGSTNMSLAPQVRLLQNDQIADAQPVMIYENGRLSLNGKNDTVGALTMRDGADISTGVGGGSSSPGVLTLLGNVTCTNSPHASYASIRGLLDLGLFTRTFHVESWLRVYANVSGGSIFNPGITKTGSGSLQFMYLTNSYTGPTLVEQGMLHVSGGVSPLGATNAGTTVANNAELYLENVNLDAEALTLNGSGFTVLEFRGSNVCSGPITLNGDCRMSNQDWFGETHDLTFSGAISGTGSLRKTGNGNLRFTGFGGNTFTGGLFCQEGWTFLSKSASAPALSGPLVIGREGEQFQWVFVEITEINQIPNSLPITLLDHGSLHTLAGVAETIGPVTLKGGLIYAVGTMTLAGNVTNQLSANSIGSLIGEIVLPATRVIHCDADSTLQAGGNWAGAGGVTKTGPGELRFTHAHTYSGTTLVQEGTLTVESNGRPGSSAAGTTVEANGTLFLKGASVTNESLVLQGGGNGVALAYHNTNVWNGSVELHGAVTVKAEPVARLSLFGAISGPGGLNHTGDGTLILAGNTDNTFAGPLHCDAGNLILNKFSTVTAVPGDLVIGLPTNGAPAATVEVQSPYQFKSSGFPNQRVTVNPTGKFLSGTYDQTISNLDLRDGWVDAIGGNLVLIRHLTVEAAGTGNSYFFGKMTLLYGNDGDHQFEVRSNAVCWMFADIREDPFTQHLTKTGTGTLLLSGSNTFSGSFTINSGTVYAGGAQPFGTMAGPTIVNQGGTLAPISMTAGEPILLAGNGHANEGALHISGTNIFTGPVTLAANTIIQTDTNAILTLAGAVGGPGGFTKHGPGAMQLLGSQANTYAGPTLVADGKLELGKTNVVAVPGPLIIAGPNSASLVRLLQSEQIGDNSPVVLQDTGWISLDGQNETIGSLAGLGAVFQSGGQTGLLTVGGNQTSTTFQGTILGGGGLTKVGNGTFTLTGNNLYTGVTTVTDGTLMVMGEQPQSQITLLTGGRLGGSGRVGHISDLNGHVAPGASTGILVCSNYSTFTPENLLEIEINGPTPGSRYDQLQVLGNILLIGGTLQLTVNTTGEAGNEYVIIRNDGPNPVTGSFTGLPEGAMFSNNGAVFQITYQGGDGNDVVLVQQPAGGALQITGGWMLPDGVFQLTAQVVPHATYGVEATTNLITPVVWTFLGNAAANAAGQLQFTDPDAPLHPTRFYRLTHP
ncbi:MAG: autotransporter-associated beta strand repeat-containing protein [Verrucomicrobiae bacterium]|nr:autotransporter-associated beta strand repeat-containing protein [Verrucomicrobiae bacterium]